MTSPRNVQSVTRIVVEIRFINRHTPSVTETNFFLVRSFI